MSNVIIRKVGNPGFSKDNAQVDILKGNLQALNSIKGVKGTVVYMIDGKENKNYRTTSEELSVFVQTAPAEEVKTLENSVLKISDEKEYNLTELIPQKIESGITRIRNGHGSLVAYASNDAKSIFIPYMIEHLEFSEVVEIISYVANSAKENYFDEIQNADSWSKSKQKDELKERVGRYLRKGNEQNLKEAKRNLERREEELIQRQNTIKGLFDDVIVARKRLENAEGDKVVGFDNFLNGLDLIAKHNKVENLIIKEDKVTVMMHPLEIKANVNGKDKKYELLGASMSINIDSAEVKFDSKSKFRSHWTAQDPHPHVNGNNGNACLGNIANTIAELASQREIYPLYLICLDFLENANTEDHAGRKVTNWKEIVEVKAPKVKEVSNPGVSVETFMVSTVFVEGGGYHTEVEMTEAQMQENGVKEYHGDFLMPDVYEKLMKVLGE